MKIKYEIELDDFFVFSDHLMKTSPLMFRAIRKGQMWWASGPLAGGFVVSMLKGASPEKAIAILGILSVASNIRVAIVLLAFYDSISDAIATDQKPTLSLA